MRTIARMGEFRNQLHYGDNLEVLRSKIPDEVADLIYLDPPFNSARNYNLLFKQHKGQESRAQIVAFEDTWTWSPLEYNKFINDERNEPLGKLVTSLYEILGDSEMMAYVVMMAPRLLELHRKLKPTGSLYLHCDPVASHYLKIILDVVFGPENFRNEITWKRQSAHSDAKLKWANVSDTILFYAKSAQAPFSPVHAAHDPAYLEEFYKYDDGDGRGRYQLGDMSAPAGGGMAAINKATGRPNGWYVYKGFEPPSRGWRFSLETMEKLDGEGRIYFPRRADGTLDTTKRLRVKRYLAESPGQVVSNVWADIAPLQGGERGENRGYPTQKPLALLERIIAASSNEGDVVLDPFAGCGTSIVAAERMNRKWIGIDITYLAINEVLDRLQTEKVEGKPLNYQLFGTPKDLAGAEALFASTKDQNHKPFEQWAVSLVGGRWNDKKGADRGIDGRIPLLGLNNKFVEVLIQVKGGNALNLSNVRDFANVIESNKALIGIMISMKPPTKEMKLVCEQMGYAEWHGERKYPRYQILTIEDLLEKGVRAEIPERLKAYEGVGMKVEDKQDALPFD